MALATGEIGAGAAGFAHQQASGSHVPGLQAELEVAIHAAAGDIGQVQRSRAGTPDVGDLQFRVKQIAQHRYLGLQVASLPPMHAGGDQRTFQVAAVGNPDAALIEEGAAATDGGEQFASQRIVDHAKIRLAALLPGNRDTKMRQATQVVVRAIQRVDDPDGVAPALGAAFLGQDGVTGIGATQFLYDFGFGLAIDLAGEIETVLFGDRNGIQARHAAQEDGGGGASGLHRDGESGFEHDGVDKDRSVGKRSGLRQAS